MKALLLVLGAAFISSGALAQTDVFEYARVASSEAVAAEALCTTFVSRDGQCKAREGDVRQARRAMARAGLAIDNFYLTCMVVMRDDRGSCDAIMGAALAKARSSDLLK